MQPLIAVALARSKQRDLEREAERVHRRRRLHVPGRRGRAS
jgi:hypothetical protein